MAVSFSLSTKLWPRQLNVNRMSPKVVRLWRPYFLFTIDSRKQLHFAALQEFFYQIQATYLLHWQCNIVQYCMSTHTFRTWNLHFSPKPSSCHFSFSKLYTKPSKLGELTKFVYPTEFPISLESLTFSSSTVVWLQCKEWVWINQKTFWHALRRPQPCCFFEA